MSRGRDSERMARKIESRDRSVKMVLFPKRTSPRMTGYRPFCVRKLLIYNHVTRSWEGRGKTPQSYNVEDSSWIHTSQATILRSSLCSKLANGPVASRGSTDKNSLKQPVGADRGSGDRSDAWCELRATPLRHQGQ
jgi:hypothetical protein